MELYLIPKHRFIPEVWAFLENNPITDDLNEIEFYVYFHNYSGIIFYIPEEDIYGLEMCWEFGEEMLIRFGAYAEHPNQLLPKLEKEYQEHLDFYSKLLT